MTDATLVINDQRIPLSDETDVRDLIGDMMNAVAAGGSFVHIEGWHGRSYDVLVSSATQVLISHGSITFEAGTSEGPWVSSFDLDI